MLARAHLPADRTLTAFGGSALTSDLAVPKDGVGEEGIPVTYVPARNTSSSAWLGWAEARGARDLFIGVNALDYSGYPDCRPEFIAAFERMANKQPRLASRGMVHRPRAAPAYDQGRHRREAARLGLDAGLSTAATTRRPTAAGLRLLRCLPAARQGL
jgi:7-cyano-7-deazaguanine synthase